MTRLRTGSKKIKKKSQDDAEIFLRQELADYFNASRSKIKLSKSKLCKQIGIAPQFYGRIEKADVSTPDWILAQLVSSLGLSRGRLNSIYLKYAVMKIDAILKTFK